MLIEGAVHDVLRRWPLQLAHYDRVAGLHDVLEIDVTGARRLLVHTGTDALTLLDVGGHDITSTYDAGKLYVDSLNPDLAPPQFLLDGGGRPRLFVDNPSRTFIEFGKELSSEWIYFLSDQQLDAVIDIWARAEQIIASGKNETIFILGGPGTGKTIMLLQLLKRLIEDGYDARLVTSAPVAEYLDACAPEMDLQRFKHPIIGESDLSELFPGDSTWSRGADVLLVDDPSSGQIITQMLQHAERRDPQLLVCGFDPAQLRDDITDQELRSWVETYNIKAFAVDECYRQKANIGSEVKRVVDTVAASTPYLDSRKISDHRGAHLGLTAIANTLTFPNPHGYLREYDGFGPNEIRYEVERLFEKPLWQHWPSLLLVCDNDAVVDLRLRILFSDPACGLSNVNAKSVYLNEVESVKGVEFQHAFVFLSRAEHDALVRGFRGSGKREYERFRLLRIPFSRAKDSLVLFVQQ
jgi:hypothetical protein